MANDPKKDSCWVEQFERVHRWHKKVKQIRRNQASTTEDDLDILFAFFLNCYHLYDWLKHSKVLAVEVLNKFFRQNEMMKICHDICVGSKHLKINQPLVDSDYRIAREYVPVPLSGGQPSSRRTRLIKLNGNIFDMVNIADQSMFAVEDFLHKNNLLE